MGKIRQIASELWDDFEAAYRETPVGAFLLFVMTLCLSVLWVLLIIAVVSEMVQHPWLVVKITVPIVGVFLLFFWVTRGFRKRRGG